MVFRSFKLFFIILLITVACDWFNPRVSENPQEEETEWEEPTSPSKVITNLKNAFEGRNIMNYSSSLSSNFVFFGDPADSTYVEPGIFNDWNFSVEYDVVTNIFNTFNKNIELYFEDSLKDSTGTDATFYKIYTMNLEAPDSTVTAVGLAHFQLALDSTNLWSIVQWWDFRIDTIYIDWGILKARSR
jgi:hypothetical protein